MRKSEATVSNIASLAGAAQPIARGFPIVGIGASAGGLDAFKALLTALPPDTGMAFVLVQHLDPIHVSLMAGLLSSHTAMPVTQAAEGASVEPNRVYLIPPGVSLAVSGGKLHLTGWRSVMEPARRSTFSCARLPRIAASGQSPLCCRAPARTAARA